MGKHLPHGPADPSLYARAAHHVTKQNVLPTHFEK